MINEINISLWEKGEFSLDDKMITHTEIELEKAKAIDCINEITKILEKYTNTQEDMKID